jgi:hypothetical protein
MKSPDKRCCGSGVCIISDAGECWCGQVWNGEKMVAPSLLTAKPDIKLPEKDLDLSKPNAKDMP